MNKILDQLLALPKRQKIGLLAGVIIALLALDFTLLFSPQFSRISNLSQNIENSRNERDKKKVLTARLPKLREQERELDGMLKEAIAQLPDRKEIPDLLSSISAKVREAGLEILLFRPRAENLQEFYAEIPVDIIVRGHYHNVVTFFDEVGRLSRLVNISNIEFKNPKVDQGQVILDSTSLATTFRFLDEAERARVAAAKAKAKK